MNHSSVAVGTAVIVPLAASSVAVTANRLNMPKPSNGR